MSGDRHDASENQSSTEIRADIDNTRQAVGSKIDKLQERLDPNRLKQQAQETVQEMINDSASSVTDYVRTHRQDMTASLADAARRNPLPTALVGLGIGWLILESISGGKDREDEEQSNYERRYYAPRSSRSRYAGRYQDQSSMEGPYAGRSAGSMGRSRDAWSQSEDFDDGTYADEYVNYAPGSYPADAEFQGGHDESNGKRQGNPLAKAAGAVKDTVGDVTGEIKDRMSDAGQEIKGRMEDVKDRMGDARDRMGESRDHMGNRMDGTRDRMGNRMDDMRHQAQHLGERGQQTMRRARYEGRRRGQQMIRNLEDNPLTYGALALAAGAALAILLPQTRTENRFFGETRDELMERGEEAFETAKERAQHVASEMRPELEQAARNVVEDVKEAVQHAKEDVKPAMDKAMEKTKEEARGAAQEMGVNPDKMTGNKSSSGSTSSASSSTATKSQGSNMTLNKDTMRGQWNQIKGEVKSKWGKMTDDELTRIEGDYDKLIGTLQSRYGYERARAEQEVNDFFKSKA